jgi:hypothetical protein
MKFLSLLVLLGVVAVVSLSGSQANSVNSSLGGLSKAKLEKLKTDVFHELKSAWGKITAPRLKDRKDICVWKICSRPLKKTAKVVAENKTAENGGQLFKGDPKNSLDFFIFDQQPKSFM